MKNGRKQCAIAPNTEAQQTINLINKKQKKS